MIDDENLVSYYGWGEVTDPAFVDEPDPWALPSFPTYTQMGGGTEPIQDDFSTVYGVTDPAPTLDSAHTFTLDDAYFELVWEESYTVIVDPGPSDQFEAVELGNELLAEIIQNLSFQGVTLETLEDVTAEEIENWGANDWRWRAKLKVKAISPWMTYTALGDLGVAAVQAIETGNLIDSVSPSIPIVGGDYGSTPRTLQVGGDIPTDLLAAGSLSTVGALASAARRHPLIAIAAAVIVATEGTSIALSLIYTPQELSELADDFAAAAAPLAIVLILLIASKT
jgi:hypothetical protein